VQLSDEGRARRSDVHGGGGERGGRREAVYAFSGGCRDIRNRANEPVKPGRNLYSVYLFIWLSFPLSPPRGRRSPPPSPLPASLFAVYSGGHAD
jgi:hypothetical protein